MVRGSFGEIHLILNAWARDIGSVVDLVRDSDGLRWAKRGSGTDGPQKPPLIPPNPQTNLGGDLK